MNLFLAKSYFKYLLKARFKKGYGLHSPFVFNLVRELIYCQYPYYAFNKINAYRKKLDVTQATVEVSDYGAGSQTMEPLKRKVSDLAAKSSINKKYGELLFRLVAEFKPQNILELGTSIGVSTLYLALPNKSAKVYTIEGCENTAKIAAKTFSDLQCNELKQTTGQFRDVLPGILGALEDLDFVFFDGHHEKQATLEYFDLCLSKANNESVFVFDDIHWSSGMEEAWKIICDHPSVTVSMDLFQLGIVFFRKECQKQHFVIKY